MRDLSTADIVGAEFTVRPEPVLRPFGGSFVVADPSVLTPDMSPDGQWHMFFHTTFGVWRFSSADGITFKKGQKIASRAMRPDINRIGGEYCLFFERTRPLLFNALNLVGAAKWRSEIQVTRSADLGNWSPPRTVLAHTRDHETCPRGTELSNPFLLEEDGEYRLYYSCGMTYIPDCGFCEPTYVSYARSSDPFGGFEAAEKPILAPDKDSEYFNLCSGCLKVYRVSDGYIGIQNGIYEKDGESRSAILLLTSEDGLSFSFEKVLVEPAGANGPGWMAQFVYASCLVRYGEELRLYFNARDAADPLRGRECIGMAVAEIG